MRKNIIVGIIFIAMIMIVGALLVVRYWTEFFAPMKEETITSIKSGDMRVSTLHVSIGNGILTIVKNETITGWKVIAKYSKTSTPPSITAENNILTVQLNNGIMNIYVCDVSSITYTIGNGIGVIILYNTTCDITGTTLNGNMKVILDGGNYSVDIKVSNGNLDFITTIDGLSGSLKVSNGDVSTILKTPAGGSVEYSIDKGDVTIVSSGYSLNIIEKNNGERGELHSVGKGIDLGIDIGNGHLILVVSKI